MKANEQGNVDMSHSAIPIWSGIIVAVLSLILLWYSSLLWQKSSREIIPLFDNLADAQGEIAKGYHFFEKMMTGDKTFQFDVVFQCFSKAEAATDRCLEGYSSIPGLRGIPTKSPELQQALKQYRDDIQKFASMARSRWSQGDHISKASEQRSAFFRLTHKEDVIKEYIRANVTVMLSRQRTILIVIMICWLMFLVVLAVWVSKDGRYRKKRRVLAEDAEREKSLGMLASGIAHDFNNLLVGTLGNADVLLAELPHDSPGRDMVKDIIAASNRAADLCRQMLIYSGKGHYIIQPLNLNNIVRGISDLLEVSLPKKIVLKCTLASQLPAIEADDAQLRQLLLQLVTNASEAIGEKAGIIKLATGMEFCSREVLDESHIGGNLPEGKYVYLDVSDTGCGMDEDTMAHIFDPFFSTKPQRRGLGLATVLGTVRALQGTLRVYTEFGHRSTFRLLFPVSDRPAIDVATRETLVANWRGSGTVLAVDDEEHVRKVARRILERAGFTVLTASNGLEALSIFRQKADMIDVVLLDLTMPIMSGSEAMHEILTLRPDAKVLISSGYTRQRVFSEMDQDAPSGFIHKPYSASQLMNAVREVIEE